MTSFGVLSITTPASVTYPPELFLFGSVQRDPAGSDRTDTIPTASSIIDVLAPTASNFSASNQFFTNIANISSTNSVTLQTNTGVTLIGGTTILPSSAAEILVHITTASTCVMVIINTNVTQTNQNITPKTITTSAITLTAAVLQIMFQPGGIGNVLSLNTGTPGQNTVLTIPDPGSTTANLTLSKGATSVAGSWTFTNTSPIILEPGGSGNNYTFVVSANPTQSVSVNLYDPGQSSTFLQFGQYNKITIASTGTTNVTVPQSGSLILVPTATGAMTLTFPNPQLGLHYLVLLTGTLASGALTINNSGANNIIGTVVSADGTAVTGGAITTGSGDKTITVGTGATGAGDSYEFVGLGAAYHVRGFTTNHAAVSFS